GGRALRLSTACQRSTNPNQNTLSLALRAAAARRRHSLTLCWNRSVLVILASWMTPATLGMRFLSERFRHEFGGSRESLWQRNRGLRLINQLTPPRRALRFSHVRLPARPKHALSLTGQINAERPRKASCPLGGDGQGACIPPTFDPAKL